MNKILSSIDSWMKQNSQIKQLQFYLAVSLLFSLLLSMQLVNTNTQLKTLRKSSKIPQTQTHEDNKPEAFVTEYLNSFFAFDPLSLDYIREHSSQALLAENLEIQLKARRESQIQSELLIHDIYLEYLDANNIKAICFVSEKFTDKNYKDRNLIIELVINLEKLMVTSIPVFKIE
jgi:hypothetical protein